MLILFKCVGVRETDAQKHRQADGERTSERQSQLEGGRGRGRQSWKKRERMTEREEEMVR